MAENLMVAQMHGVRASRAADLSVEANLLLGGRNANSPCEALAETNLRGVAMVVMEQSVGRAA